VGTLVLLNAPPSSPVTAWVKRSLPEPCASVGALQLASGFLVALPAAVRHAKLLPPAPGAGRDTDPVEPSTVSSWNGWLNRTVPAASALGADTVVPTVTALITSITAAARDTIRLASGEKTIPCLLSGLSRSVTDNADANSAGHGGRPIDGDTRTSGHGDAASGRVGRDRGTERRKSARDPLARALSR
jgi:hypothetical protein